MNFVEELRWRGMIHDIMPGTGEQLDKEMTAAYIGFDPTAASLHIGSLVQIILTINAVVFVVLAALSLPLYLIWRDIRETLQRFRIVIDPSDLSSEKEQKYLEAAKLVFDHDPGTIIFIYGHTHLPSLRRFGHRAVINTGTWLKRLKDVPARVGYLPEIYVPFFSLNYFKISEADGKIAIDYHRIEKDPPHDLSLLQRLLVSNKRGKTEAPIPARTLLEV